MRLDLSLLRRLAQWSKPVWWLVGRKFGCDHSKEAGAMPKPYKLLRSLRLSQQLK